MTPQRIGIVSSTTLCLLSLLLAPGASAAEVDAIELLRREVAALRERVVALEEANVRLKKELNVERLVVRRELIVSDTGAPWERGFEAQQMPRGVYARSLFDGAGGLWVRSRLIKGEIDDPFDDRFHALQRDGRARGTPGHISWNTWVGGAWRQLAIVQGEILEPTEVPWADYGGGNHPGRLRFQSFRPNHDEPLTDALLGQGMMSLGGGGFGGGGLPYPREGLEIWGGRLVSHALPAPSRPVVVRDDATGERHYILIAVGADGVESPVSPPTRAGGRAQLRWDSVPGADAYYVIRDGTRIGGALRIEGAVKEWRDPELKR